VSIPVTLFRLAVFVPSYLLAILRSNLRIAHDVLTPEHRMRPVLLRVKLDKRLTGLQILLIANLITMTPGTICLEYDRDARTLTIHLMYADEEAQTRAEIARITRLMGGTA